MPQVRPRPVRRSAVRGSAQVVQVTPSPPLPLRSRACRTEKNHGRWRCSAGLPCALEAVGRAGAAGEHRVQRSNVCIGQDDWILSIGAHAHDARTFSWPKHRCTGKRSPRFLIEERKPLLAGLLFYNPLTGDGVARFMEVG